MTDVASGQKRFDSHVHLETGERTRRADRDISSPASTQRDERRNPEQAFTAMWREIGRDWLDVGGCGADVRFNPLSWSRRNVHLDVQAHLVKSVREELRHSGFELNAWITVKLEATDQELEQVTQVIASDRDSSFAGIDFSRSYDVNKPSTVRKDLRLGNMGAPLAAARNAGYQVASHCGWYDSVEDVETALAFGATRLGHGIALGGDEQLLGEVQRRGIVIEVCPTAALTVGKVEDLGQTIRQWAAAGIRLAVGTDHPLALDTNIKREFELFELLLDECRGGAR